MLEYRPKTSEDTKQVIYLSNQFIGPTLSNFYACVYFTFSVLPTIFGFRISSLTTVGNIILSTLAYTTVLLLNGLRAKEATRYRYHARAFFQSQNEMNLSGEEKTTEENKEESKPNSDRRASLNITDSF
jgi:ABC-type transport system involved in cytochrome bd biosynthesis fused ATPase/permease subunit